MKHRLYTFCISTIVEGKKLNEFASKGSGRVTERSPWKTGKMLFLDSCKIGTEMPVIFSNAAYNAEDLLYWAILEKIEIEGQSTTFQFNNMKKIRGNHLRGKLILRSKRRPIAPNYIRPYAICQTPEFLD